MKDQVLSIRRAYAWSTDLGFRPTRSSRAALFTCIVLAVVLALSACGSSELFPLSAASRYQSGIRRGYTFTDASRGDREVKLTIWYPAAPSAEIEPQGRNDEAEPDLSGAPYPLILSSVKVGAYFGEHLATHGFVVVGVGMLDSESHWGKWLIDFPLDLVFALEEVSGLPLEGLEGMIDASRAGAMGYSFDGYDALALSGARVDPQFYQESCAAAVPGDPLPEAWWIDYICNIDGGWDEFVAHAGAKTTTRADGLWQPLTAPRIQAVMPMAPEGAWLFGERGLAAVDRPTLIIAATEDDINYYDLEAVYIFEHLGTPDKAMISFVDQNHMMIYNSKQGALMRHFATAFFGYYLQGQAKYARYFSEDFVSKREGLAWGVYKK